MARIIGGLALREADTVGSRPAVIADAAERARERTAPSRFENLPEPCLSGCGDAIDARLRSLLTRSSFFRDTPTDPTSLFMSSLQCAGSHQVGCQASRSIRWRISRKERRRQVACGQLQDEVPRVSNEAAASLISRCRRLVRDQLWTARGRASRRRRFPRLYAMTPKSGRTSLADAVTGEQCPVRGLLAFLDALLRRATLVVEADDGPVVPVSVVTMKPTRGNSSPRRCSTVAINWID